MCILSTLFHLYLVWELVSTFTFSFHLVFFHNNFFTLLFCLLTLHFFCFSNFNTLSFALFTRFSHIPTYYSQSILWLNPCWLNPCLTLLNISQTEAAVSILKFLESCVVQEGADVHFECVVSHDALEAQWKLQDVPLQNNEMNVIEINGQVHSLTLRGVTKADSGTVIFSVGNNTSTASLTVRGKGTYYSKQHGH